MAIPQLIHQLWISAIPTTPDMPELVKDDTKKWITSHPDFKYKLWSIDEVYALALKCKFGPFAGQDIIDLIEVCRFPAMKADLARLLILYTFGGVWIDLKLIPKRQFLGELLNNKLVIVEHQKTEEFPDPAKFGLLNNWFFACEPNSPFIYKAAVLALQNVKDRLPGVWHVTGPRVFMTVREQEYPKAFEDGHPGIKLIRTDDYLETLVGFGWGSYNSNGMHWSERMKREPTYAG